jgi:hypothetical protein
LAKQAVPQVAEVHATFDSAEGAGAAVACVAPNASAPAHATAYAPITILRVWFRIGSLRFTA